MIEGPLCGLGQGLKIWDSRLTGGQACLPAGREELRITMTNSGAPRNNFYNQTYCINQVFDSFIDSGDLFLR